MSCTQPHFTKHTICSKIAAPPTETKNAAKTIAEEVVFKEVEVGDRVEAEVAEEGCVNK